MKNVFDTIKYNLYKPENSDILYIYGLSPLWLIFSAFASNRGTKSLKINSKQIIFAALLAPVWLPLSLITFSLCTIYFLAKVVVDSYKDIKKPIYKRDLEDGLHDSYGDMNQAPSITHPVQEPDQRGGKPQNGPPIKPQ